MFVITGASDGLGLEVTKLLVAKGKTVVGLSRSQPSAPEIVWIKTDLANEQSIEAAAEQVLARPEKLEALINCAGVVSYEDIDKLSATELERVFKIDAIAPMLLTSRLFNRIKQDRGDILNVGSTIATKQGYPRQAAYGAAKWALRGFSQNLQLELKETGSRVINFLPGGFRTHMHEKFTGEPIANPDEWMRVEDVAACLVQLIELPKNMEISEVIINRKTSTG